jgi:hypothetical protein
MAEVFTDDGRIITAEITVLRGCMDDEKTGSAFLLDSDNQFTAEDGQWTQILGERSTIPISMVKPTEYKELQKIINKIYHESSEGEKLKQYENSNKKEASNRMMWLVLGPVGLLAICYMATLIIK